MRTQSKLLQLLSIFVILTTVLSSINLPIASAQGKDGINRKLNAETGKVSFIGPESGRSIAFSQAMGLLPGASRPGDPALALAKHFAPEFGIRDATKELSVMQTNHPGNGRVTVRYQQKYQGIPVMGGELIVNINDNGDLYSINGEASPNLSLSTQPAIDAAQAKQIALQAMAKWNAKTPEDFVATEPELWIFDESLLQPSIRPVELVWRMDVTSVDNSLPIRELMLINSQTGNPDFHFNQIDSAWNLKGSAGLIDDPDPTPTALPTTTPVLTETSLPTTHSGDSSSVFSASSRGDVTALSVTPRYVDVATGSDSNTCTQALPCKSIQKAINVAAAGDTVFVADGIYYRPGTLNVNPNVVIVNKGLTISGGWKNLFTEQTGVSTVDGEYQISGNYKNNNGFLVTAGPTIIDHFAIQNSVSADSGGIYLASANLTVTNSTIQNNHAGNNGAGIFAGGTSSLTLINSTISGNTSGSSGGGIRSDYILSLNIQNSTISYNTATNGGGISVQGSGTKNASNSIIANNQASTGPDCDAVSFSLDYSILESTSGCSITGSNNQLNIDPRLETELTGTPPVHRIFGGSPAVDAGASTDCPSTDQQGNPRPLDGNGDGTAVCDMGAYELVPVPNVPAEIRIYSGNPQQATHDQAFGNPLEILVKDNVGSLVNGVSVTFTAPASGASGTFADSGTSTETVTTSSAGIATSSVFTANGLTGSYSVIASVGGLTSTLSFSLTNRFTPGVATSIIISSGSNQKKTVNQVFSMPFVVQLFDGNGDPVNGANVTFTAPASGASGTFLATGNAAETVSTSASGLATSSPFTANSASGVYKVSATTAGLLTSADMSLQNLELPGIAKRLSVIQGTEQTGIPGYPYYTPLVVQALDDYSKPVGGVSVTFTVIANGANFALFPNDSMAETVVADSNGIATAPPLQPNLIASTGSFTVTISSPGMTDLVTTMDIWHIEANTYTANHDHFLPGSLLCTDLDVPCSGDAQANSAQDYALQTENLYLSKHGRSSVDNSGMTITSTLHYCYLTDGNVLICPLANAFWNGSQMVYGDRYAFANADDVIAHELTHAVTQYESNLFYVYQSGAINESLSDLWGEYLDQTNGKGNDSASVKWLIGEDISGLGAIRNMKTPSQFDDPDKMTSSAYYKGEDDNGGVHSNSGVNNKAIYLMVEGGVFNGKTIRGIGWDKTADLYYEAQTNLLGVASNYSDLYYALQQACRNIGLPQDDCFEVTKALDAVQMSSPITGTTSNQITAPLCPTGMTTYESVTQLNETFDGSGSGFDSNGWFTTSEIYNSQYQSATTVAGNGVFDTLTMRNAVHIFPGTFLHFNHSYDFEIYQGRFYDGGVVELSVDNGNWFDAGSFFSAGANYNGTLVRYSINPNPLQGRKAFVGTNFPYYLNPSHMVSSRFDLSPLADHDVRVRFVYGTDMDVYWRGWFIDDVKIYTCMGTPSIPTLQFPANNSLTTDYTPLLNWTDSTPALNHYQLNVDDDADFSSPVVHVIDLTTSEYQVPDLLKPNTKYYWRVNSFNDVDGTNGWSAVWNFRTALTPPAVSSPVEGFASKELRPVFDWEDVATATGYTIQIAKDTLFKQIVNTGNPVGTYYVPTADLPKGGAPLYWRVLTKGANGPSAYSGYRSLTTPMNPPPAPSLSLPASNALVANYKPTFTWKAVVPPTGTFLQNYIIQVDDTADFSSPVIDNTSVIPSFPAGSDLASNTKFYWRLRAVNTLGEMSNWSAVWNFRTALVPPVLTSPADGFTSHELRPMFDWEDVSGATGYTVQISDSILFTKIIHTGNPLGSFYVPPADLPRNASLYWRVQTKGTNGPSDWSATPYWSFTTPSTPPPAPALSSPVSNALVTNYKPTFTWKVILPPAGTNLQTYIIQVDDNVDFSSPIINNSSPVAPTFTSDIDLTSNAKFYWRVRAVNNLGEMSNWSIVWYFRTVILSPILNLPVNDATSVSKMPLLDWSDVSGNTGYTLQIWKAGTTPVLVKKVTLTPNVSQYQFVTALLPNTAYFWKVQTKATNGPSAWSEDFDFTTGP